MPSTFRNSFYAGLLVAFIIGLWLVRLWGAENQVRLHSEHFLQRMEKRNAAAAGGFLAPDYHDAWGDDRARLLLRLQIVVRLFSSLTITASEAQTQLNPLAASWRARIHLDGRGEAAAEITSRVNSLTTPFVLKWQHESWKPWDWKLISVTNDSLEIPASDF